MENIVTNYASARGLIPLKSNKIDIKKVNNPIKIRRTDLNRDFSNECLERSTLRNLQHFQLSGKIKSKLL